MRYNSRKEVENIGRAGSYYEYDEVFKARVLSSFWLYCDTSDLGFAPHMTTYREGYWESWITFWMSQNVAPGSRCLDIGANHGYYTMFLAEHRCQVTAIEPQPKLARLIEKSRWENLWDGMIEVRQVAVSDTNGVMPMRVPTGHGMNATLAYDPRAPHGYEDIEVEVITMDDLGPGFDFVKVDVEGAEDKVLQGARKFIERNPECVWLLEWCSKRMDYDSALAAAEEMFETFDVTYVDFDGLEKPLTGALQLWSQVDDWMLVLRKKQ